MGLNSMYSESNTSNKTMCYKLEKLRVQVSINATISVRPSEDSAKVPRRFHEGSTKVPRRFRESSAKLQRRLQRNFPNSVPRSLAKAQRRSR